VEKYKSMTRDRGVTTIPAALRERAAIRTDTALTWVEIEPQLWLVGPEARHPEDVAAVVAAALVEPSPFPKLMRRLIAGEIPQPDAEGRTRRDYAPVAVPELTEDQMIALGAPAPSAPRHKRGRD
jgi:hypothetical protein